MMAKPTFEELKNLTHEQKVAKYPEIFAPHLSAGTFVDRPFLDRINPFTPFNAKKFVPSENAKKLLEKYKEKYGKNLVVLPLSAAIGKEGSKKAQLSGVQGLYRPTDLIGGSNDRRNRYVYLNPEEVTKDGVKSPGLFTLSHEAYHAFDPSILNDPVRGKIPTGIQRMAGGVLDALFSNYTDFDKQGPFMSKERKEYLDSLPFAERYKESQKEPMFRFKKELDAQLGAAKDYKDLGIEGKSTENEFLPNYRRMYIRNRFDQASDEAFKKAQGYDYESGTYTDTGLQTVRGIQKELPQLEKEFKQEAIKYEDEQMKKVFPDYPGFKNYFKKTK